VSATIKDRHLFGAGAAACAVCCAPPVLALLGIASAGVAASLATVVFAGLAFGAVVLTASLLATWAHRRTHEAEACAEGHVDLTITARPPDALEGSSTGR
jgi:hypothetical protein